MYATAGKVILGIILAALPAACKAEKPAEPRKPEPAVILRPKHPVLSEEQRQRLGFPGDLITGLERSAVAEAEPFFTTVVVPSENLKGEKGFEKAKLAGFSVRTGQADELITSCRAGLRVKGYLIFKSRRGYGSLPDTVSVIRGNSSYDILKIQGTEGYHYGLNTRSIISWLKKRQRQAPFFITGAGADWVEARFVRQPNDPRFFARKILSFAPDVRRYGPQTADELAAHITNLNGFYLAWD